MMLELSCGLGSGDLELQNHATVSKMMLKLSCGLGSGDLELQNNATVSKMMLKLSCGLGFGDPGSPELRRELRFGRKLLLLLSKSSQTAKGRKGSLGMLGDARAGFWVMENGSSGGACLDICRYLQLSHQVFHTPQSPSGGRIQVASPMPPTPPMGTASHRLSAC